MNWRPYGPVLAVLAGAVVLIPLSPRLGTAAVLIALVVRGVQAEVERRRPTNFDSLLMFALICFALTFEFLVEWFPWDSSDPLFEMFRHQRSVSWTYTKSGTLSDSPVFLSTTNFILIVFYASTLDLIASMIKRFLARDQYKKFRWVYFSFISLASWLIGVALLAFVSGGIFAGMMNERFSVFWLENEAAWACAYGTIVAFAGLLLTVPFKLGAVIPKSSKS